MARAEHALVDLRRRLFDGRPVTAEDAAAVLATLATRLRGGHPDRPSTTTEAPPVTEPVTSPVGDLAPEAPGDAVPPTKPAVPSRRRARRRRLVDTVDLDTVVMERSSDYTVSGWWRVLADGHDGQVLLGTVRRGGGHLGSRHAWEARSEDYVRVHGGPWPTRQEALIGLLMAHRERPR